MKFTCIRTYLIAALSAAERVIEKNPTLPILQNILITVEKGKVFLSATNLEVGVHTSVQAKIEENGKTTVPARTLLGFLNYLTNEKITIQEKTGVLTVSAGAHKADIKTLDPKDFPIIPELKEEKNYLLPAKELFSSLSALVFLTANGEVRPELGGVFCSFEKGHIRMAATD